MKKLLNISLIIALLVSATSCKKSYLDINTNPNSASSATPELVLPVALTSTGGLMITYLDFGNFLVGYQANAGGYSFTGSTTFTYNFTTSSNTGLYNSAFSNLKDYQYVINSATAAPKYVLYGAVARIMKSYTYQKLVDEYGDIPYSEALLGGDLVTPKYDNAASVYQALVTDIDGAIAQLKANATSTTATALTSSSDVIFKGDITKWIKFANNIKLRLLTRARKTSISAFVATEFGTFSSEGFLTEDVLVNPGYTAANLQNPIWGTYFSDTQGNLSGTGRSRIPTPYIMSYYNGVKLNDGVRGALMYKNFGTTPVNQLGNENAPVAIANYPAWYIGTGLGIQAVEAQGIIKSRVMGTPIWPASETYFLLAEAALNGYTLSGSAVANFNSGIAASFSYLQKFGATNAVPATNSPATDATAYQTTNATNYLANYNLATSYTQRLEAIITQKYIALNFIDSYESWSEFRRTTFPTIANGSTSATATFASIQSGSTRVDKLPLRGLYPQTEYNLNTNTPSGIGVFTTKIFWDPTADDAPTN
jgi:hypothetical protein